MKPVGSNTNLKPVPPKPAGAPPKMGAPPKNTAPPKPAAPSGPPITKLVVKPIEIKYPTVKKGTKRKANPPPKPAGARGPLKIKTSGAKAAKTVSMAD